VSDGVEIVDVGPRQLKGLDEERLFQLSPAEAPDRLPVPQASSTPHRSHAELLGDEFSQRIDRFVEEQLESSLSAVQRPPPVPESKQSASRILAVIFGGLIVLLVVKLAFF
jgi:hypothetical protein